MNQQTWLNYVNNFKKQNRMSLWHDTGIKTHKIQFLIMVKRDDKKVGIKIKYLNLN